MLENWLSPVYANIPTPESENLHIYKNTIPNLMIPGIILISWDKSGDEVRKLLYRYDWCCFDMPVYDLGTLRNEDPSFIIPLIDELSQTGSNLIFLGSRVPAQVLFNYHQQQEGFFNPVIVDESCRLNSSDEDENYAQLSFMQNEILNCFQLNVLGCQMHQFTGSSTNELYRVDYLRLGKIRNHKKLIEPMVRDADFMYFNLQSVRKSDAPGKFGCNPSGLMSEEASQICRYGGLSDTLKMLILTGYQHSSSENSTYHLLSQMIWYHIEGFNNRKSDYPLEQSDLTEYIVDVKSHGLHLTFCKSKKSGRWWFKLPLRIEDHEYVRHIPCAYEDYKLACHEDLTDRIIHAFGSHVTVE